MPIYTYECRGCGVERELIVKFLERYSVNEPCPSCGEPLTHVAVARFTAGKPAYQMGAVLGSGAHIKGHFGKDARRRRKT